MQKILVVVDMQNDFIDGALGTTEAAAIVGAVAEKVKHFDGKVIFTRDTHPEDYLNSQEGKNLPVNHCIKGSEGWQISPELVGFCKDEPIDKPTFGSVELGELLKKENEKEEIENITFVGLCTDICVISNVMLAKAFLPEVKIIVDASGAEDISSKHHSLRQKGVAVKTENFAGKMHSKTILTGKLWDMRKFRNAFPLQDFV